MIIVTCNFCQISFRRKIGECGDFFGDGIPDSHPERPETSCAVCDAPNCSRHDAELLAESLHPWKNVHVPVQLDKAVEEFLELALNEFVYSWYSERSTDECFVHQVRVYLRRALAVLARRLRKVDVARFLVDKVAPACVAHVDSFLEAQNAHHAREGNPEQAAFAFYGDNVHPALRSRNHEVRCVINHRPWMQRGI
jgi:sorting nexin-14